MKTEIIHCDRCGNTCHASVWVWSYHEAGRTAFTHHDLCARCNDFITGEIRNPSAVTS